MTPLECGADSVRLSATAMFALWTYSHSATLSGGSLLLHVGFPGGLLEFQGTELQEALGYGLVLVQASLPHGK